MTSAPERFRVITWRDEWGVLDVERQAVLIMLPRPDSLPTSGFRYDYALRVARVLESGTVPAMLLGVWRPVPWRVG